MLAESHSQAARVRALLQAAGEAATAQGFVEVVEGSIGMEVVLSAPADYPLADATNFLGGIGDVLEHKGLRGALVHLGSLQEIALYRNDRQIREVHYRCEGAAAPSYTVRIWRL